MRHGEARREHLLIARVQDGPAAPREPAAPTEGWPYLPVYQRGSDMGVLSWRSSRSSSSTEAASLAKILHPYVRNELASSLQPTDFRRETLTAPLNNSRILLPMA